MRIFAGEYVCGGGLADLPIDEIPSSLRLEGSAMLHAITADISEFADAVVPIDHRFADGSVASDANRIEIDPNLPLWKQWSEMASGCDAAIIVAPEIDGTLAKAVSMLRAAGINVIAGSGDFLRTASDKLLTAKVLTTAGVAHPPYEALSDRRHSSELESFDQFVVKPRDGCGTQEIQVFDCLDRAREALRDDSILQGWMSGEAVSISMIASDSEKVVLPSVRQKLGSETCEYAGGSGPMSEDAQNRLTSLANRTIDAMPPTMRGFVGIDMLLGERPSDDCVIEINPRLTTSYVGLRKMVHGNLAARFFGRERGPVKCSVSAESVRWTPDGQVWINDQALSAS